MTIYLACTVRGDRGGVLAGRAIGARLQHHGHVVLTMHLLAEDVEAAESQLSEADVYRRDLDWLSRCDVLVAEASGSSYGVGFEVGYVLGRAHRPVENVSVATSSVEGPRVQGAASGQRVVLLYDAARRDKISRLITGNRNARCTTFGYSSIEELMAIIDREFATPG
jgi:Nucleoside 2-deoxyribosyltransferase